MVFGRKSRRANVNTRDISAGDAFNPEGVHGSGYDAENAGGKGKRLNRVADPVVLGDSDVDSAHIVTKQLELEASNSIKYRTCSWEKVN